MPSLEWSFIDCELDFIDDKTVLGQVMVRCYQAMLAAFVRIWEDHTAVLKIGKTWWRHQMETFSALLAICAVLSPVAGEFLIQRPVARSFVFFDLRVSKQSWGWWFDTPSSSLWHHCNDICRSDIQLLFSFMVISDVYRSCIPNKIRFTKYCLTQWMYRLTQWMESWNPLSKAVLWGRLTLNRRVTLYLPNSVSYFPLRKDEFDWFLNWGSMSFGWKVSLDKGKLIISAGVLSFYEHLKIR